MPDANDDLQKAQEELKCDVGDKTAEDLVADDPERKS